MIAIKEIMQMREWPVALCSNHKVVLVERDWDGSVNGISYGRIQKCTMKYNIL